MLKPLENSEILAKIYRNVAFLQIFRKRVLYFMRNNCVVFMKTEN